MERLTKISYPGFSKEFRYDSEGRVSDEIYTFNGGGQSITTSYTYDAFGRLQTISGPGDIISYEYNAMGQKIAVSDPSGDTRFGYDAWGNLEHLIDAANQRTEFVYDSSGRLVKAVTAHGGVQAEYYYDPFGRRLWKEVNGVKTYFFYSDEGLVAEYGPSGAEIRSYGYKPDSTWTTDPLWLKSGGQYYFYHNDHLGTPQKLTTRSGQVVWQAYYSAFGEVSILLDPITNNLRFPGQYYDEETGLHYNWHRYYDPGIGRYVSVDPIGFDGGEMNLYSFVRNNSLKYIDFNGLQAPDWQIPVPDFDNLLQDKAYLDGLLTRINSQTAAFPLQLGHMEWWSELIEASYELNKNILKQKLLAMCPEQDCTYNEQGCPTSGGVVLEPSFGCSRCCRKACEEQVNFIVKRYMDRVKYIQEKELMRYGNILVGWPGNQRRGNTPALNSMNHSPEGIDGWIYNAPGEGRKCEEWVEEVGYQTFVDDIEANGYHRPKGKKCRTFCFRGATIRRETNPRNNHEWVVIYAPDYIPNKENFSYGTDEKEVVIIDPWPFGGFVIVPTYHPFKATELVRSWFW